MYIEWTQHLKDPKDKSTFENEVYRSKEVLDHIKHLVDQKMKTLDRSEMNIETYSLPNWDSRQAHKNGQRSSLDWLYKLVDLDNQKKEI